MRTPTGTGLRKSLSYDNARLSHALIVSGRATGQEGCFEARPRDPALADGAANHREGPPAADRQQRLLSPRRRARELRPAADRGPGDRRSLPGSLSGNGDVRWYEQAQHAFDWFIGGNDLGLELYVPETGGCRDGLHMDRVNGNQGAESTLAFLLSLVEMRQAQKC